jgi:dTDP-4-amino-4,6-dideoxygalactose transaminase
MQKPVFADIEEETYGLDSEDVKEKITNKTKAIIPIHYGGCPCKIRELREVADDHNLILIEDAAESLGAEIKGKKVGSFGDAAMLSFCANKVITTGEGGCMVTNSKEIYEKSKLIRSHGRLETENYFSSAEYMDYVTLGYNFRMSNITAALGISQLKKVNKIIEMRRDNAAYINKKLSKIESVTIPNPSKDFFHVYQMYTIRVRRRDDLMKYLIENGIMTKVYFQPAHQTEFFMAALGYKNRLKVTEHVSKEVLTLPMYPALTRNEIDYITDKIDVFIKGDNNGR